MNKKFLQRGALPFLFLVMFVLCPSMISGQSDWLLLQLDLQPSARYGHAMVYDSSRDEMVLFGGFEGYFVGGMLGDTWVFNGNSWQQKFPVSAPSPRHMPGIAFDPYRQEVVLFGGADSASVFGDTWVWDGETWMLRSTVASPERRCSGGMVYDEAHREVVLFGGWNGRDELADTWIWDGMNWSQKFPTHTPPKRKWNSLVYDAARGEVVLFGGYVESSATFYSDTWVWNGSDWTERVSAVSPSPRSAVAMAFDPVQQKTVLFGGFGSGSIVLEDTWTWDGTAWQPYIPTTLPRERLFSVIDFHRQVGGLILFGGISTEYIHVPSSYLNDTWTLECPFEFYLSDPACVQIGNGQGKMANRLTATNGCLESSYAQIEKVEVFNGEGQQVMGKGIYDIVGNDIFIYPSGKGWMVCVTITTVHPAGGKETRRICKPLLQCR